ncbi:MAG: hypothetical protein QM817_38655 [Archangium sp.]
MSSFDRSEDFAFSKAAGETCRYLTKRDTCGVHARRFELGLSGCSAFDCSGAGQVLTARLSGREALRVEVAAFHALVEIHFCLRLVELAERLGFAREVAARKELLLEHSRLSVGELATLDTSRLRFVLQARSQRQKVLKPG